MLDSLKKSRLFATPILPLLLMILVQGVSGCDDGRPERVKVSGIVLLDGEPLNWGYVRVLPSDARAAGGRLDADGRFALTCFDDEDGAVIGTHVVTVSAGESLGPTRRKWHAPKKYADPKTSELTVTIDGPTDDLRIELTWDGGKPFVEESGQGKTQEPLGEAGEGLSL
ncbi:MAG: hypothetical protein KDA42_13165 [Planctomycetales bacterium]|nr:hypothetical protein [Planctomycetales bacterium]